MGEFLRATVVVEACKKIAHQLEPRDFLQLRNRLGGQSVWVAAAVPLLVVVTDPPIDGRDAEPLEEAIAELEATMQQRFAPFYMDARAAATTSAIGISGSFPTPV